MSRVSVILPPPTVPELPRAAEKPHGEEQKPQKAVQIGPKQPLLPGEFVTPAPVAVTPGPVAVTPAQAVVTPGPVAVTPGPEPGDPPWADPRPDLVADHSRWWLVLEAAYRLDGHDPEGLFGILFGLRCCGARLELANAATWGARPEDPPPAYRLTRGDELSEAEYADLRQRYLLPRREVLTRLLSAPSAAQIAHPPLTGCDTTADAQPVPSKAGADPTAQPALLDATQGGRRRLPGEDR